MNKSVEKSDTTRCWVIKLGSSLLTNDGCGLKVEALDTWVSQVVALKRMAINVVMVSSGAVAEGVSRLAWGERPHAIHKLQAAAAVGQMGLIQAYEHCFLKYDIHTAQILLTHDDVADRRRYLNARSTLRTLVQLNVVPIVNENDTVATEEIRFGDNDSLAGLVANLVEANRLVILTDQRGLYEADPRLNKNAKFIEHAKAGDKTLEKFAGKGGTYGRGGMLTKLNAAAIAAKSGTDTIVASGLENDVLIRLANNEKLGTFLKAEQLSVTARKQWLASQYRVRGTLTLDEGAVKVLCEKGKSLLAVGVTMIEGDFKRGEIVSCHGQEGREVARGLVNYSAEEARKIYGQPSEKIEELLGYVNEPELIHRDNLILL